MSGERGGNTGNGFAGQGISRGHDAALADRSAAVDDFAVTDVGCPAEPDCVGDVDGDGVRDLADLAALLASFGTTTGDPGYNAAADFDASGGVDLADLSALLSGFGVACP